MSIKRNSFIIMLKIFVIIFCTSTLNCIYAMTSVEVTNHFETGIVDIRITEHQVKDGLECQWEDNPTILPGQEISKIPRIHNDGNDCYARAKIQVSAEEDMEIRIEIQGISDKWLQADDGYYYYTEILKTEEYVDLFQSVYIPENFSEDMMEMNFTIDIIVEAIQAKNFTPQFDLTKPWGDVEILECEKEGMYAINCLKQAETKKFQIIYQGESKKLITNSDDFFKNFSYMMPGDYYCEKIDIFNNSDNNTKLYFRCEAFDNSELLEKIKLKIDIEIEGENKNIYDGNLKFVELSDDIMLGTIEKYEKSNFNFEIIVPEELNNQYSISNSYVKWIFSTEPISNLQPEDSSQTGDLGSIRIGISIIGIIMGMLGIMFSVMELKRKTYERNK